MPVLNAMGVLLSIIIFGLVLLVVLWFVRRSLRLRREREQREERREKQTPVVYEKTPEDGVDKKPLE
jgi:membrane protein implicated in regulation of membrane protease activity